MTDLTKLTAKEFRNNQSRFPATTVWEELWRRAERQEQCEAILRPYANQPGNAAVNRVARAALEEK